jgi:HD-GYP domain-containing protein (c-di-GMP phosphodiesterase class II)
MAIENSSTRKRIPVDEIKPGMFVVTLDRAWLRTPFFFHRKLITSEAEIDALKRNGIREVTIDTSRGVDCDHAGLTDQESAGAPDSAEPGSILHAAADLRLSSTGGNSLQPLAKELQAAQEIHEEALATAQAIFDGATGGAPVRTEAAKKVVQDLTESIARSPEANLLLMQMRRFQRDLFTHAVNVCVLSLVVGAVEDMPIDRVALGLGALLHDVGETRIPRNLLRKREEFSDMERRLIEQHPKLGAMLLQQNDELPESARRIVLDHHERIDGSGFPDRKSGDEISLMSQVVAITDAYDDMLSGRNRAVLQPVEVLRQLYIQSNEGALDRELVERIIRGLGVYPVGSLVELSSGERGIVIAANRADTLKPTVRIIISRTGLMQSNGPIVSLADGSMDRRIVGSLDPGKERIDPMQFLKLTSAVVL